MDEELKKFEDWNKTKSNPFFKLYNNLQPNHVIIIGVMVVIGILLYNRDPEKFKSIFIVGLGILIVYIISLSRKETQGKLIPRSVAQKWALKDLKSAVGIGRSFKEGTKIIPTIIFRDEEDDKKITKYNLGFEIKQPEEVEKDYIYQMNPYTGDCRGVIEKPAGFTGEEIKDKIIIEPKEFIKEEKLEGN